VQREDYVLAPLNSRSILFAIGLAVLNLVIGGIVASLKLPVFLDSFGFVLATILFGWPAGLLCAIVTLGAGYFVISPYLPAYFGTAVAIVIVTEILTRCGMFRSFPRAIGAGIIVALVAAACSIPMTAFVFRAETQSGADAITALLVEGGENFFESVIFTGVVTELADKIIVCAVAYAAAKLLAPIFSTRSA